MSVGAARLREDADAIRVAIRVGDAVVPRLVLPAQAEEQRVAVVGRRHFQLAGEAEGAVL